MRFEEDTIRERKGRKLFVRLRPQLDCLLVSFGTNHSGVSEKERVAKRLALGWTGNRDYNTVAD